MATQAEKLLRIEHPESGRRAAVTEHDYKSRKLAALRGQTYQEAGYNVVSYEDGTAYEDGAEPSKYAIASTESEIGADSNTGHTNMDGGKLTDAEKRSAGIETEKPASSSRARRSEPEPAPAPAQG